MFAIASPHPPRSSALSPQGEGFWTRVLGILLLGEGFLVEKRPYKNRSSELFFYPFNSFFRAFQSGMY